MLAAVLAGCGGESWTANEVGLGSVTLSWTPPTLNTDGSPLTDLAGYRIYYGTQPDHYRVIVQLDNPGLTTYVVDYLPADTYYFAMTAVNSKGIESALSGEASTQVF
jgi:fibronectin type 3 domain-containing protein